MTLKELENQLLALTAIEKAQALQLLMPSFSGSRGITKTLGVCGGEACIGNTRIPVWLLVSFRHQDSSDAELLSLSISPAVRWFRSCVLVCRRGDRS